ncbi:hypothetical protein [Agromyces larvae]|uniref:Uncharacterized protein n=1 Tax=Agromyces larvae TaxID=2929802 RepID=A0ABY4BUE7_9MICO|nr:hypothetical protein [Agromyces larvae]UOE42828.1 hypothetical protein MTO99_11565 [Agromyces larvae]
MVMPIRGSARLGVALLLVWMMTGCAADGPPPSASRQTETYDALTLDLIDQRWEQVASQFPNAVRPEVRLVRYVTPESAPAELAGCLVDEGFPDAEIRADGNLETGPMSVAQQQAYAVGLWKCSAMFPYDPAFNQKLTEQQIGRIYEYYTQELTDCLDREGYMVEEPPSEASFIEGYYSEPELWSPYARLAISSESESMRLHRECPAMPADLFE